MSIMWDAPCHSLADPEVVPRSPQAQYCARLLYWAVLVLGSIASRLLCGDEGQDRFGPLVSPGVARVTLEFTISGHGIVSGHP